MADAEVKTRLVIEQEGDPQLFRDTAAAIRDLTASLRELESAGAGSLNALLAQLDQIIAKAREAAAALAQLNE